MRRDEVVFANPCFRSDERRKHGCGNPEFCQPISVLLLCVLYCYKDGSTLDSESKYQNDASRVGMVVCIF